MILHNKPVQDVSIKNGDEKSSGQSHLRVEEYLWAKEPFIADINIKLGIINWVESFMVLDPLAGVTVIFVEFLCYVWAYVTVSFLNSLGGLHA